MNQINFDTAQLERVARLMAQAPEIAQDEITRFITAITAHLQGEVQQRTPTAHGTLRASIFGDVKRLGRLGAEGVVSTSLAYAVPVELGTAPHMPPVAPLIAWARQRLGVTGADAERAGWAVARKIARVGTDGAFMFRDTFQANEAQIKAGLDLALDRIQARMAGVP